MLPLYFKCGVVAELHKAIIVLIVVRKNILIHIYGFFNCKTCNGFCPTAEHYFHN